MQKDSYNRGGYIAFLFSVIFSILFFIYLVLIHPGVDLHEVTAAAPAAQKATATQAQDDTQVADVDVSGIAEPWVPNPKMLQHGHHIFLNTCAVCHGVKGLGNGPAGTNLNPHPRNFVEGKWLNGGDSINLFKTISTGIKGSAMASFAHLPVKDRWALIQFIRSITHNKIKDDPAKLAAFGKSLK